jgi:hypothetical protein
MGIQINGQTDTISATDGALNIGGTVTVNVTGDATGLTGTPDITVGVVTASSAVISGDLTVNGTTTTLDTTLTEVDKLEVGANNTTVGVAITQSGSGDILRLYDGATQAVTVRDGGSVGIGTDNPQSVLHLLASDAKLIIQDSDSSGNSGTPRIQFQDSTGAPAHGEIGYVGTGDSDLSIINKENANIQFHTNNTERLRIDSNGNVGVGTQSPNLAAFTGPTFTVGKSANPYSVTELQGSSTSDSVISLIHAYNIAGSSRIGQIAFRRDGADNSGAISFTTWSSGSSSERLRITSGGNMGLGVTPESWGTNFRAFQIGSTGSLASQVGARTIELATNAYNNSGWKYTDSDVASLYYQYNGEHIFSNAPSGTDDASISFAERLRITSAGSILHKGNNSNTADNTDGDSGNSAGYPAGGSTFNKNLFVTNSSYYGQGMLVVSHTKQVTLDGSTNHDMIRILNREGGFIGHIYAGYTTSGDGAAVMYKFNTFYAANSLTAELGPVSRSSDSISVNVVSVGDGHLIRVNGNGFTGQVTVAVTCLSFGTTSGDHFGIRYY